MYLSVCLVCLSVCLSVCLPAESELSQIQQKQSTVLNEIEGLRQELKVLQTLLSESPCKIASQVPRMFTLHVS